MGQGDSVPMDARVLLGQGVIHADANGIAFPEPDLGAG